MTKQSIDFRIVVGLLVLFLAGYCLIDAGLKAIHKQEKFRDKANEASTAMFYCLNHGYAPTASLDSFPRKVTCKLNYNDGYRDREADIIIQPQDYEQWVWGSLESGSS